MISNNKEVTIMKSMTPGKVTILAAASNLGLMGLKLSVGVLDGPSGNHRKRNSLSHYDARGEKNRDQAVIANAWHQRSDAFSSVPVVLGLALVLWGGPEWHFVDSLMAVVLGFIILAVGFRICRDALKELTDHAPSAEIMELATKTLEEHPEVMEYHAIRARTVGGLVEMDFHILVNPDLSVRRGHDIATEVKRSIMEADKTIINVIVHVEPME